MPRFFYSVILCLIQPLVLLRLVYKSMPSPAYRHRIKERYGFGAPALEASVWVHAVSVGEAITARGVIEHLLATQTLPVVVSTTTPTGAAQVQRMFGDRVIHRYLPQDISGCMRVFMRRIQPRILIVMETELWPNLIACCNAARVPVMLVNGRLSTKSAKGYGRLGGLTRHMLAGVNTLCVQTETECQRFVALGAAIENCCVVPSLKFDATVTDEHRLQAAEKHQQWVLQDRFVWLAASTHTGEDEILLAAHKQLLAEQASALLILVPRHPERFDTVAELAIAQGFKVGRFSDQVQSLDNIDVLVLDAMGQLMWAYGLAQAVFVGGSLNGGGGHNIVEPALWSKPVLSGPGLFNFQAVSEQMSAAGGLSIVVDADAILQQLLRLQSPSVSDEQGQQALTVANSNKGGLALSLVEIDKLLSH